MDRLALALASRYAIERELGRGGMATVYLAEDVKHHRKVAVKVLLPELAATVGAERFLREIAIAAQLTHPHILAVYDSGDADGFLFYVMPYVEGESLRQRLTREGQLPVDDALRITQHIAAALSYAHAHDVLHRDIKPENILLSGDEAVVADFGVARAITPTSGGPLTNTGFSVGTPAYMSPEQASAEPRLDERSDLYSLGCVLYEMLVGEPPHTGPNLQAILARKAVEPVPRIRLVRETVPEGVEHAVDRALAKRPADRFSSVQEFAEALGASVREHAIDGCTRPRSPAATTTRPLPPVGASVPLPFELPRRATSGATGLPFVGREEELARLQHFLDAALANEGCAVFVTGEAGSGKTALVGEFCRRAAASHVDLVIASGSGNAHTGSGDPYRLFREILGLLTGDVEARCAAGSLSGEHATRLWNLMPTTVAALWDAGPELIDALLSPSLLASRMSRYADAAPGWAPLADLLHARAEERRSAAAPRPSFEHAAVTGVDTGQFVRVLRAVARERPLLLVLDDLHWADTGSVRLLFELAREAAGSRILLIGLYRPSDLELGLDGGDRHPLEAVVHELQRGAGEIHVRLGECDDRAFIDALVDAEPNALGGEFRDTLFNQTRGDALFTVELLRDMRESGALVRDDAGRWTVGAPLDWRALPARVEGVIAERLARVPVPLQRALSVASVEGELFTLEVVASVIESSPKALVVQVGNELEKRHHLVKAHGIRRVGGRRVSTYRFRHILFQRYLYDHLDAVERAELHEQAGRALDALYGDEKEQCALSLARHFKEAGLADEAARYLHLAGERAGGVGAYREAITHFEQAIQQLELLPATPERDRRELTLTLGLGWAMHSAGVAGQERAFTVAHLLAERVGSDRDLFWVLAGLQYVRGHFGGDYREGRVLAEQCLALARREGDATLLVWALEMVGRNAAMRGDFRLAFEHFQQLLAIYDPRVLRLPPYFGGDWGLVARGMVALAQWMLGYPDQAHVSSLTALTLAREADPPLSLPFVAYYDALIHIWQGDPAVARKRLEEVMSNNAWLGQTYWEPIYMIALGWCRAHQGEVEEGIAAIKKGRDEWAAMGNGVWTMYYAALHAQALRLAGRADEGLSVIEEAASRTRTVDDMFHESTILRTRGELLLTVHEPQPVDAEAAFRDAILVARQQEARLYELEATTSLARLLRGQGCSKEGRAMLGGIFAWFTEGFDTVPVIEAKRLLAELEQEASETADGSELS